LEGSLEPIRISQMALVLKFCPPQADLAPARTRKRQRTLYTQRTDAMNSICALIVDDLSVIRKIAERSPTREAIDSNI